MTVVAFTWQRYHMPLPTTASKWRRLEKITMTAEQTAPHPYAGMSILDIAWQELDEVMDLLMEQGAPDMDTFSEEIQESGRPSAKLWYGVLKEWGELRGQAQGLAFAIAVLTNPYAADVPAVKKEAVARWESRQSE